MLKSMLCITTIQSPACDDENSMEIRYEDENIWLTQKMMTVLYDVEVTYIKREN